MQAMQPPLATPHKNLTTLDTGTFSGYVDFIMKKQELYNLASVALLLFNVKFFFIFQIVTLIA